MLSAWRALVLKMTTAPAGGGSEGRFTGLPAFPTPFIHYDYGDGEPPKTLHEMKLMQFEGAVCDKPGWWTKLEDEAIVALHKRKP